jgi:hypothetical protein
VSEENVEIVLRAGNALERAFEAYWAEPRSFVTALENDDLSPEAKELFGFLDPDVAWNTVFAGVAFQGIGGIAQGWDWLLEAVAALTMTLKEASDLGGDQVLAVLDRVIKDSDSGMEMLTPLFSVITIRNGLVVRNDEHPTREQALAAVAAAKQAT